MSAWTELSREEADEAWRRFASRFVLGFGMQPDDWRKTREPPPFVTYSVADWTEDDVANLHECALAAFRRCTPEDGELYALDANHASYRWKPHTPFAEWERPDPRTRGVREGAAVPVPAQWMVPVFPNGDYYVFLALDASWGWVGHPWERSICVYGERLLSALEERRPAMFGEVLRASP